MKSDKAAKPEEKTRLDVAMCVRGLARSRTAAAELIRGGKVLVGGVPARKPSELVSEAEAAAITVTEPLPYVSRGGVKLAHTLKEFSKANLGADGIDVTGRTVLDIGSSTGGFTDCLLQHGAAHVFAVDVGTAQLDPSLRNNPRVTVMEKTDVRKLAALPAISADGTPAIADMAVIDVSFISLAEVLPEAKRLTKPGGPIIALIKPQFETAPEAKNRQGIVKDETDVYAAVQKVTDAAARLGLTTVRTIESPITGGDGNREFLALFSSLT